MHQSGRVWSTWVLAVLSNVEPNVQVEDIEMSVKLACELRPYQQEGIAWLAFLRRTGLHGCLADDMGLGKTLQATAIIAGGLLSMHACHPRDCPVYAHMPVTVSLLPSVASDLMGMG